MTSCSVEGCTRPRKSRGWCNTHYERWRVHGDPTHETWTKVCTVDGCEKPHKSGGYCSMHWERSRRTGDVGSPVAVRVLRYAPGTTCAVETCDRGAVRRSYCDNHYRAAERHGDPTINLRRKADRVAGCIACGKPTAHGLRQFCSSACQMFIRRSGTHSRDTCQDCGTALPVVVSESGLRMRGNRRGRCLLCAEVAPCPHCGESRRRGGSGKLICLPCRRPRALADQHIRRARKSNAMCEHGERCVSSDAIATVRAGECLYCGADAEHADHFEPLARGGKHCVDNLVPACSPCNLSKGDRDPWSWWANREVTV